MGVNDQLHATAALSPTKEVPVSSGPQM